MEKEITPKIGDRIKVELHDGTELEGTFDIHPLANECVRNKYGFPINYKKVIEIL